MTFSSPFQWASSPYHEDSCVAPTPKAPPLPLGPGGQEKGSADPSCGSSAGGGVGVAGPAAQNGTQPGWGTARLMLSQKQENSSRHLVPSLEPADQCVSMTRGFSEAQEPRGAALSSSAQVYSSEQIRWKKGLPC